MLNWGVIVPITCTRGSLIFVYVSREKLTRGKQKKKISGTLERKCEDSSMANSAAVNGALVQASDCLGRAADAMAQWNIAYERNRLAEDNATHAAGQAFEIEMVAIEGLVTTTPEFFAQPHFRTMAAAMRNLRHVLGTSRSVARIAIETARQRQHLLAMTQLSPADMNHLIHNS